MIYFFNKVYLIKFRIINKLRRMLNKNSILLSSKKTLNTNFKANSRFSFIQIGANDGISFDFLYEHRHEGNIGELINIALTDFEEANRQKLNSEDGSGVFRNIDFNSSNLGDVKEKNQRLK